MKSCLLFLCDTLSDIFCSDPFHSNLFCSILFDWISLHKINAAGTPILPFHGLYPHFDLEGKFKMLSLVLQVLANLPPLLPTPAICPNCQPNPPFFFSTPCKNSWFFQCSSACPGLCHSLPSPACPAGPVHSLPPS